MASGHFVFHSVSGHIRLSQAITVLLPAYLAGHASGRAGQDAEGLIKPEFVKATMLSAVIICSLTLARQVGKQTSSYAGERSRVFLYYMAASVIAAAAVLTTLLDRYMAISMFGYAGLDLVAVQCAIISMLAMFCLVQRAEVQGFVVDERELKGDQLDCSREQMA